MPELTIQFRILVREEQWMRIPLRLDQAVLREPPQYQGPGEQLLHFEGDGDGYVLWIRAPAGKQQQVTLKMLLPLASSATRRVCGCCAPGDHFGTEAQGRRWARRGQGLRRRHAAAAGAGKSETEFTVLGLGGDFELTWFKAAHRVAEVPAVLEAIGAVTTASTAAASTWTQRCR